MAKYSSNTLYCFSPPIMLATFITEIVLLVYTFVRYRLTPISRIVAASLFFLAFFQLCEYNVCGRFGVDASVWSRLGYVAITMLPALGVHFVQLIAGRGWRFIKWIAYANALVWAAVFGISERAFTGHVCAGNYVIFQLNAFSSWAYGVYYYSWLLIGIVMAVYFAIQAKQRIREALLLQVAGYLIFLVPTTIIAYLTPATRSGIPSIMCGFAVLYAFIMVFGIVPIVSSNNDKNNLPEVDNNKT